jgi:hypothetical protein
LGAAAEQSEDVDDDGSEHDVEDALAEDQRDDDRQVEPHGVVLHGLQAGKCRSEHGPRPVWGPEDLCHEHPRSTARAFALHGGFYLVVATQDGRGRLEALVVRRPHRAFVSVKESQHEDHQGWDGAEADRPAPQVVPGTGEVERQRDRRGAHGCDVPEQLPEVDVLSLVLRTAELGDEAQRGRHVDADAGAEQEPEHQQHRQVGRERGTECRNDEQDEVQNQQLEATEPVHEVAAGECSGECAERHEGRDVAEFEAGQPELGLQRLDADRQAGEVVGVDEDRAKYQHCDEPTAPRAGGVGIDEVDDVST